MHALDLDTGAIVWDNGTGPGDDASFAPTSSVPGLMFIGSAFSATLRGFDSLDDAGAQRLVAAPVHLADRASATRSRRARS